LIARFSRSNFAAWVRNHPETIGILLLAGGLLVISAGRFFHFRVNNAPPGSDGGQWLAFGYQLFGGERIKAGFQDYPPLIPFLVRVISTGDGLLTLKLLGIASSVAVCVPVYLLLRTSLFPWLAALLSLAAAFTPYQSEVLSFGGYPQLLGTSFLMLTVFFLSQGLNTGKNKWFLAASLATVGTVSSNVLPTMVLAMSGTLILLMWSYKLRLTGANVLSARLRSVALWWILPSIILCLPFSGSYLAYLSSAERSPANPQALTLLNVMHWLSRAWLWEFILWVTLFLTAFALLLFNFRWTYSRNPVLFTTAVAVLVSGFIGLFIIRELRFGEYIEMGMVLILGLLLNMLVTFLSRPSARRRLFAMTLTAVVVTVLIIGGIGLRRSIIAYYWYDVIDSDVFPALEWLRDNRIPGSKVAATGAFHGHNYGWWIEGYAHLQTYMAGDAFLFIDNKERDQVALTHHLLMEDISPWEVAGIARAEGIRFLFLDRRVLERPLDSFVEAGFTIEFENSSIVVMSNSK